MALLNGQGFNHARIGKDTMRAVWRISVKRGRENGYLRAPASWRYHAAELRACRGRALIFRQGTEGEAGCRQSCRWRIFLAGRWIINAVLACRRYAPNGLAGLAVALICAHRGISV